MANKVEFPDGFNPKNQVNKTDKILIADGTTGEPFITTVDKLKEDKVDKVADKSLVDNTAIDKLNALPNKTQLDTELSKKVDKVAGKDLIDTTSIDKLNALPSNADLDIELATKVDKVEGKELSDNNYSDIDKNKVDAIYLNGEGKFFLSDDGTYKKLNSNGGGFYNVSQKHPLAEGQYYTLATAVNALALAEIDDADKPALIITFETSNNEWLEYRFIGDVADFLVPANWVLFADKDVVKGLVFNGDTLLPDSSGNLTLDINTNVEQTINPNSTDPVSSSAVASEFAGLSAKYGTALSLSTIGEEGSEVYQINLLDENGNVLSSTDQFSGGGGSGEVQTTKIVLSKLTQNPTAKKGDLVELSFSYDHIDTTNQSSTGLGAKATVTIVSGALSSARELNISAGSTSTINVSEDLIVGNNTVRVTVEVNNGETIQVSSIAWSVLVVNLVLTSSYDFATATPKGSTIYVPFTLNGSGNKNLKCYVNGNLFENRSISNSSTNGSFTIPTGSFPHGNINIQLLAELETSTGAIIKSNSIYYDLIIVESNNNNPVVATKFNFQDGTILNNETPYLQARQLEDFTINYAVYHPQQVNKLVVVKLDGATISTANVGFVQSKVTYRSVTAGTYNAVINVGTYNYLFNVVVAQSSIALSEPQDNMVFKFTAQAKSNADTNKESWIATNGITTATLTNVKFGGDGWVNNTLRLTDNGRATINYKPLDVANRLVNNSWTFQVKFKISEVVNDNAQVIKCLDSEGTGFVITAQEAKMVTKGKAEVAMKLASGEVYNIAFVSYPIANTDSSDHEKLNDRILFLYINGIISGIVQKSNADSIYQTLPSNITLGANGATTEIYNIRHYNRYLNDSQMLDLHLIDLDSVDTIIDKYNDNAIIDGNGNITVDNVADDMRYVIVTGSSANGVPVILESAVQNNKDARYDTVEILHIKKSQPELNFKLVGGCIRLQGTSSLAYPIKNYRIYFKNSAKVAGQLYTGVDPQGVGGTLQSKAKFSFNLKSYTGKKPQPVDVWCLKADYAESSSSHNTGLARLVNNTLVAVGDKTPPQKYVDPNYQYDVRTTVDGEPCYLFYRAKLEDEPIFLGKFNFNNDKSTEAVFGFLDIPNYHINQDGTPSQWVVDKFNGVNPTECWEFLNNDYPMGKYQDDDFDTMVNVDGNLIPNWTRVFEARYPDNQDDYMDGTVKPYYLERLVKWVKSTSANPAKYKAELGEYFDVNYLCDYFVITQIFGAVDQMVKNAMLGFWYNPDVDKVLGHYIFYDNDTIMGVRNDGRLKYHWDVNRQTLDPELSRPNAPSYAYMGHDSVLWNNLESQFATEIGEAYKRLRARMTNDEIFNMFNKEQSDKYVERVFNVDAMNKYVKPATLGIDVLVNGVVTNQTYSYLESSQGNRKSHRQWWMTNRLHLFDAKYSTGLYTSTDIAWKGYSSAGARIKATTNRDFYLQLRRESTVMAHNATTANVEWQYIYPNEANIGTIFHLYGGVFISKLDMSLWGGFTDLNLPRLPVLEELILGESGRVYTLPALAIGDKLPMLKKLNVTNYTAFPTLDLTGCNRMEEVVARGCTTLASINFASGAPINKLVLPQNLKTLHLNNFATLTNAGITFPDGMGVQILNIENCPLINWQTMFTTMASKLTHVRITNINLTGNADFFNQFNGMGGVSENGTLLANTPALVGTYQLNHFLETPEYNALKARFPYLNIKLPEYTLVKIFDKDPTTGGVIMDTKNVQNVDNNTGYGTPNAYVPNGHISIILNKRHRYLGKQGENGVMTLAQLHDEDSNYFADAVNVNNATPAILDGSMGDMWVYEPHYWYRGITDFHNRVTYAMFSSNTEKPSSPVGTKKIKYTDAFLNGDVVGSRYLNKTIAVGASVQSAMVTHNNFSVIKIAVSGYKKVKFPFTPYHASLPNISSMFVDSNGLIIRTIAIEDTQICNGQDIIENIPTNATHLYVSIMKSPKTNELDVSQYACLSLTDNVLDLETEWVERKPKLISPFETSYVNNKYRSLPIHEWVQLPYDLSLQALNQRNFVTMDGDDIKDINNLMFFKYGDRDIQAKVGMNTSLSNYGISKNFGMKDTVNSNGACVWEITNQAGDKTIFAHQIQASGGYENLYSSSHTTVSYELNNPNRQAGFRFNYGGKNAYGMLYGNSKDYYLSVDQYAATYPRYVQWGIELVHHLQGNVTGSSTSFYPDTVSYQNGNSMAILRYSSSALSPLGGIFARSYQSTALDNQRIRLAYNGTMLFTTNINAFKNINDVTLL